MELMRRRTLPEGLLGKAIDYALKRWEALTRFVDDGVLEIDSNFVENSIRPSASAKRIFCSSGIPRLGSAALSFIRCWAVAAAKDSTRSIISRIYLTACPRPRSPRSRISPQERGPNQRTESFTV